MRRATEIVLINGGGRRMIVETLKKNDIPLWEEFVKKHPDSTNYHQFGWQQVINESFIQKNYSLTAKNSSGSIRGILPLIYVKSYLFGNCLVSMPFLNYGGILAEDKAAEASLMNRAAEMAKNLGADFVEYRCSEPKRWELPVKTHKVSMTLKLPDTSGSLWESFPAKLKSQIRRPIKEGITVRWGKMELVDPFYEVFSSNMRDLGTPVYGKNFFRNIIRRFSDQAIICVVYHQHRPVGAGFLSSFRDKIEIPWASSLRRYNSLSPNMLLYWSVLEYACDMGFQEFDFGRCTVNGGTYAFKKQWGAKPTTLHWYYSLNREETLPSVNVGNPGYQKAIQIWKKLPIWVTRQVGPEIVRGIP